MRWLGDARYDIKCAGNASVLISVHKKRDRLKKTVVLTYLTSTNKYKFDAVHALHVVHVMPSVHIGRTPDVGDVIRPRHILIIRVTVIRL